MSSSGNALLVFGINVSKYEDDYEDDPEWLSNLLQEYETDLDSVLAREGGVEPYRKDMTEDESIARYKRMEEIVDASPVKMIIHGSYDYAVFILGIPGHTYRASQGDLTEIKIADLRVPQYKIDAFHKWNEAHGVYSKKGRVEPKWFLVSLYG